MAYHLQQQARRLAFYPQPADRTNSNSSDDFSSNNKDDNNDNTTTSKRPIKRIDANAPLQLLLSALEEDGCVVINDFTNPTTLSAAHAELKPQLGFLSAAAPPPYITDNASLLPSPTPSQQQQQSLLLPLTPYLLSSLTTASTTQKLPTLTTVLTTTHNPLLHSLTTHFLTAPSPAHSKTISPPNPALSLATASLLPRGIAEAEPLTRPDAAHFAHHPDAAAGGYARGRDVSLVVLVPLGDVERGSGAGSGLSVVMGSHLWGDEMGDQDLERGSVPVEMEKGDALVCLGSCYLGREGREGGMQKEGEKEDGHGVKAERTGEGVWLLEARFVNGVLRPEWELRDSVAKGDAGERC